jgi:RNA polymerase sigma-70 factor (ECF subfamily)
VEHRTENTRWTLIRGAAAGRAADREEFARRYEPVIRAYLGARWRGTPLLDDLEDTMQETFLACFRDDGALARVDPDGHGRFRSFLYGVVLNMARRVERSRARLVARREGDDEDLRGIEANQDSASRVFDRAWASSLLKRAAELQAERAGGIDETAVRRVELLRVRFGEGLPIREIAARWNEDAAHLHREYAKARREFRDALREVVRDEDGGTRAEIDAECERLIDCFR